MKEKSKIIQIAASIDGTGIAKVWGLSEDGTLWIKSLNAKNKSFWSELVSCDEEKIIIKKTRTKKTKKKD